MVADGKSVEGVTWDKVDQLNADHAQKSDGITKDETLNLLRRNSAAAAAAIRSLMTRISIRPLLFHSTLMLH
jgi:hypothetical protein